MPSDSPDTVESVPSSPLSPASELARAAAASELKSERGQFFTMNNPFTTPAFRTWLGALPATARFLEPFAGANNLVRMIDSLGSSRDWTCYDLEPADPEVIQRDTLAEFPTGFDVVVTNPPYLAKNVAARKSMPDVVALCGRWDNLYKRALAECLAHTPHVAAIVPESFITSGEFRDRLFMVISLTDEMFTDTEVPVCLAVFNPAAELDPARCRVYRGSDDLGTLDALAGLLPPVPDALRSTKVVFNDPQGGLGLLAIDNTVSATVAFCDAALIDPSEIKISSRHRTRISIVGLAPEELEPLREQANVLLSSWREQTQDVLMTAFMGLRADGFYRRRLDFAAARHILLAALAHVRGLDGSATSTQLDLFG